MSFYDHKLNLILLLMFAIVQLSRSNVIQASSMPNEAQVAVLDCSKKYPNVYYDLAIKEWMVHLKSTKCYNTENLLDLCKIVYPALNVVNVMRLDEPVKFTIYGCKLGNQQTNGKLDGGEAEKLKDCSKLKVKRVQPYKCLHGEFQSSELYIPPRCQFQHLFSNDGCQTQDHWNLLSNEKCKASGSILNSSMLLQWCDGATNGISTFSGIEFVCCPKVEKIDTQQQQQQQQQLPPVVDPMYSYTEDEDIDDDEDDNEINNDEDETLNEDGDDLNQNSQNSLVGNEEKKINDIYETNKIQSSNNQNNFIPNEEQNDENDNNKISEQKQAQTETKNEINYELIKEILNRIDSNKEEMSDMEAAEGTTEQKEQYEKQKKLIISSIQSSLDNLVKEKENGQKYLNGKPGKLAKNLLDNINDQFQLRFNRLNDEKERLLLQEEISYEQQVQAKLNEKKLNSMQELNRVMQEQEAPKEDAEKTANYDSMVRALYQFYTAQENDRLHMVTVYKKLKAYFPSHLKERSQSIINHLESIDRALNETTFIFQTKFPQLALIVLPALNDHLKRYDQVRIDSRQIIADLKNPLSNANKANTKIDLTIKLNELTKRRTKLTILTTSTSAADLKLETTNKMIKTELNDEIINSNFAYDEAESEADEAGNNENDDDDIDDGYDSEAIGDKTSIDLNEKNKIEPEETKSESSESDKKKGPTSIIEEAINDSINIKRIETSNSKISRFYVIIGVGLSILISVILILAMMRRKRMSSRHMIKHGFVPVETTNPEDRHISSMQINGYENPTYKFFEQGVQA